MLSNVGVTQNHQMHQLIGQVNGPGLGQGLFTNTQPSSYSQPSVNTSDNGTLIEMIQQMHSNFMGRLSAIEHNVSKLTVIES